MVIDPRHLISDEQLRADEEAFVRQHGSRAEHRERRRIQRRHEEIVELTVRTVAASENAASSSASAARASRVAAIATVVIALATLVSTLTQWAMVSRDAEPPRAAVAAGSTQDAAVAEPLVCSEAQGHASSPEGC